MELCSLSIPSNVPDCVEVYCNLKTPSFQCLGAISLNIEDVHTTTHRNMNYPFTAAMAADAAETLRRETETVLLDLFLS
jgi:hypothetical protein